MVHAVLAGPLGPLVYVAAVVVVVAALGRSVVPRAERLPVRAWGWRDLIGNTVTGLRVLARLGEAKDRDRDARARRDARAGR